MRIKNGLWIAVVAAVLFMGLGAQAQEPGGVLDQKFDPGSTNGPEMVAKRAWAQTFTPGVGGRLDHVEVYLNRYATTSALRVSIYQRPAGQSPVPTLGTEVGYVLVQASEVFEAPAPTGGLAYGAWLAVDFSSQGLYFEEGDNLAIALTKVDWNATGGDYGWYRLQTTSQPERDYTGGRSVVSFGGGRWRFDPGLPTLQDMLFRTYMSAVNEPPIADAGEDLVIECSGAGGSDVSLSGSGSTDPDGDALTYEWSVPAGAGATLDDPTSVAPTGTFPFGATLVTLTVSDGNGGSSQDRVWITVEDTTSPLLVCTPSVTALWPPKHQMVPVDIALVVSETCSSPSSMVVDCTVVSSEPDDANGDGSFTGDVDGEDAYTSPVEIELTYDSASGAYGGTVYLRAERDGSSDGRVYSIACRVADAHGNSGSASCVVVVPHDKRK